MKNNRANRHNDRGFTLSEVLLTVAILVVLFALAAVPVSKMRRELRQTELDSKAEILFQTAQNRMTQLLAAGMEEKYKSGGDVKRFTYIPLDAEEDKYDETDVGRLPLWYVTDAERTTPPPRRITSCRGSRPTPSCARAIGSWSTTRTAAASTRCFTARRRWACIPGSTCCATAASA